jgi:hypothetical protein
MTVRESHDISLALQQSIEQLDAVERAFVHVDWRGRDGEDEHNAEAIATKIRREQVLLLQGQAGTGTGIVTVPKNNKSPKAPKNNSPR